MLSLGVIAISLHNGLGHPVGKKRSISRIGRIVSGRSVIQPTFSPFFLLQKYPPLFSICLLFSTFREVVDLILDTGFDINARTARGTALHEAAICGKIDVVRRLLEAGINLELRDQQDKTVLEIMNELKTSRAREVIHIVLGKHSVEIS